MIDGHGDDTYRYKGRIVSNFSSNVPSWVDLSALQAHLCHCLQSREGQGSVLSVYPEPMPYTLEKRLANRYRLPAEAVCVTNGATEAIYLLAQTFRGTNSAVLQPTFSEYADACRLHAHRVVSLYQLPTEREHYRLPAGIRMLWLCNPNNPTGSVINKRFLSEVIVRNPEVCFVIDQSYEYFTLQPLFTPAEAAEHPNLLLLHSMTKRYAVPGLRLGYITGPSSLLHRVRTNRMPWSVNALAIEAGLHLLEHDVPRPIDIPRYLEETDRLCQALGKLGALEVWETDVHFMLVRLRIGKASALKEYLAGEHGILIREASNFDGLNEQFFRIATQTPAENDRLVEAIGEWLRH